MLDNSSAILPSRDQSVDIETVIVSVNYGDFLRITLPVTKKYFRSITIVTSPHDCETLSLARQHGVHTHLTDVWYRNGANFNKAAAINEYLAHITETRKECWILLLDADVLFSESIIPDIPNLDKRGLYSVRRRICKKRIQWEYFMIGFLNWDDFPLSVPPIKNGKVWGCLPTSNPAALCGYVHLWNLKHSIGMKRLPNSNNAARYDVGFALSFPETMRGFLENREVLHLGPEEANWNGRCSERW